MFKKKENHKSHTVCLSAESCMFIFICFLTGLLSGAAKLGFFTFLLFVLILYGYFALCRYIWKIFLRFFRHFITATVENGKKAE